MLQISLSLLLIPYGILLLMFLFFALVNVSHLVKYGATTKISFIVTFSFLVGTVVILAISWWTLGPIDWSYIVQLKASGPSNLQAL